MVKYRLVYFNARGRAEIIRYIFAYAGQKYEDFRIELDHWQLYKPRTLFGQLPVLEISDDSGAVFQLAQTLSIARFLANQFGLVGTTDLEKAKADMISEQLGDIFNLYSSITNQKDQQLKTENLRRFFDEILPYYASLFEKLFEAQKTMFVAADVITYADLAFAAFFDLLGDKREPVFEKCEICRSIYKKIDVLPEIQEWKAARPKTEL